MTNRLEPKWSAMPDPATPKHPIRDRTLAALVAVVMIGGGIAHFATPQAFAPLVPSFLPVLPVLYGTGLIEIAIGLAALWPGTRGRAGLVFAILCAAYMPLHLWDFFRPDPVFAPPAVAALRVAIQLLFIWVGLALWRSHQR